MQVFLFVHLNAILIFASFYIYGLLQEIKKLRKTEHDLTAKNNKLQMELEKYNTGYADQLSEISRQRIIVADDYKKSLEKHDEAQAIMKDART